MGTSKRYGITLFEPNGIGKNYGLTRRTVWTPSGGFESREDLAAGGFKNQLLMR
ncbi:hypothetical protein HZC08_00225 [Candidatus Micrarchaeota archaeon]|nr:hypothetical protein [Candidatus Micrarchaeota archaeon]